MVIIAVFSFSAEAEDGLEEFKVLVGLLAELSGCGCADEEGTTIFIPQAASTMARKKATNVLGIGNFNTFLKWTEFIFNLSETGEFGTSRSRDYRCQLCCNLSRANVIPCKR